MSKETSTPEAKDPHEMADGELCNAVAREVMGWTRTIHCNPSDWITPNDDPVREWSPLSDWNHTMEVVDKLLPDTAVCFVFQRNTLVTDKTYACFYLEPRVLRLANELDGRRAILIAALEAVRSPKIV